MNSKETNKNPAQEGIFDARQLGAPKMLILGVQHMFAMFGATVSCAGSDRSQRIRHAFFRGSRNAFVPSALEGVVPAFLGSSFAF